MNRDDTEQFLNDMLRGMVACRQYDDSFNNPERHISIKELYGRAYRKEK